MALIDDEIIPFDVFSATFFLVSRYEEYLPHVKDDYGRFLATESLAFKEDFLQEGRKQVAAGYVIYGSSTMLVFATGNGVNGFTYDPSIGVFYLSHPDMKIPEDGQVYSIDPSRSSLTQFGMVRYLGVHA